MGPLQKVKSFLAAHRFLESVVLVSLGFLIVYVASLAYLTTRSMQLIAQGDSFLKAEEFGPAVAAFSQAKSISVSIPVGGGEAAKRLELTEKLQKSNTHFVVGLQFFGQKQWDKASAEFKQVEKDDPNLPFAASKLDQAQKTEEKERQVFQAFEDANKRSNDACAGLNWRVCISAADSALSLINEDYRFDPQKVAALQQNKKLAAKKIAEEASALASLTKLRVPILIYHYIRVNPVPADKLGAWLSVPPQEFEKQMQYLAQNGYNTINVATVVNALKNKFGLPSKPVVLTFDDGYRDFYTTAFPILKKYNLHAEIYVVPGFLGSANYLTWEMVKEVAASGLVTVGAHTMHHVNLARANQKNLVNEIVQSKQGLEKTLGITVTDFAYPYGAYNAIVTKEVEKAGFGNAVTTNFGYWHLRGQYFTLPRVSVGGGASLQTFISHL